MLPLKESFNTEKPLRTPPIHNGQRTQPVTERNANKNYTIVGGSFQDKKKGRNTVEKCNWNEIPDEELNRLNRHEMNSLLWLFATLNSCKHSEDDLSWRLDLIPEGKQRFQLVLEQLRSILNDLIETIPRKQCKQFENILNDMELRFVPKFTPTKK